MQHTDFVIDIWSPQPFAALFAIEDGVPNE
jgi:hypothetical protein